MSTTRVRRTMGYEPPCAPPGSSGGFLDEMDRLATGVFGYAVEHEGRIYIPVIEAEHEGAGDVGRFLDSLSSRCCVPNVVSGRLCGMLRRRGWRETREHDDNSGSMVDVWLHPLYAEVSA